MTIRLFLLPAVCAVALSACDGDGVRVSSTTTSTEEKGALKVVETLQCPDRQGDLTRKGTASEGGTVCTYVGPRGAMVMLHLVSLGDMTPAQALKSFEDSLSESMPQAMAQIAAGSADRQAAQAEAASVKADGTTEEASVRTPGISVDARGDEASVRMPGIRIEADGDKATVNIGGFTIDADDAGANIEGAGEDGSVSIQAHDDSAEIRTSSTGAATRSRWILTDSRGSAEGWRVVGYEARGPVGGPIVVATVRSKDRDHDRAFEDAKDLVALNVGE